MPHWLALLLVHLKELGLEQWENARSVSNLLKPIADVVQPFHDLGVVTIAILFAIWQFITKRDLKRKLDRIQQSMKNGEDQPWLLEKRKNPLQSKQKWFSFKKPPSDERDTKYISIYNQKGGVGKTMLAMNLAAYLNQNNDVLLLDLDYQGSLSSAMLAACEIEGAPSQINDLFERDDKPEEVIDKAISLHWTRAILESEREEKLSRTKIITAHYPFLKLENQLTMKWLVDDNFKMDIRYRVAQIVRSRAVRKAFDVVIFDCPPRLTMGTINALCASTHLLIPTILDSQSARPVGLTLDSITELKRQLNDNLQLAGIVGNRNSVRDDHLSSAEEKALNTVHQSLAGRDGWGSGRVFRKTIPRRAAVTNAVGEDIPYLADREFRKLFDDLGDEIADAMHLKRAKSSTTLAKNGEMNVAINKSNVISQESPGIHKANGGGRIGVEIHP